MVRRQNRRSVAFGWRCGQERCRVLDGCARFALAVGNTTELEGSLRRRGSATCLAADLSVRAQTILAGGTGGGAISANSRADFGGAGTASGNVRGSGPQQQGTRSRERAKTACSERRKSNRPDSRGPGGNIRRAVRYGCRDGGWLDDIPRDGFRFPLSDPGHASTAEQIRPEDHIPAAPRRRIHVERTDAVRG